MNLSEPSCPSAFSGELRVRTGSPDEYAEILSLIGPGSSATAYHGRTFDFLVRAHMMSNIRMFMARMEHGNVLRPPEDYVGLTIPLYGEFEVADRRQPDTYNSASAHILREDNEFDLRVAEKAVVLVVNADAQTLGHHSIRLHGTDRPEATLPRQGLLPMDTEYGQSLFLFLSSAWRDLCSSGEWAHSPVAAKEFEFRILTGLSLAYAAGSEEDKHRCRAEHLKRAIDYVMANLSQPLSLADLCEVSGVSASTLIRAFKERFQKTPSVYVRDRRLDAIRRALLAADADEAAVTQIALKFGFGHLGRFAGDYFKAFGERPSETLRAKTGIGICQ